MDYSNSVCQEAARKLGLTPKTIETYLTRASNSLETRDLFSTTYRAYDLGLISLQEVVSMPQLVSLEEKLGDLTPRQKELLAINVQFALKKGYVTRKCVVDDLGISLKTLEVHFTRLYRTLGIHNYAQLATAARVYEEDFELCLPRVNWPSESGQFKVIQLERVEDGAAYLRFGCKQPYLQQGRDILAGFRWDVGSKASVVEQREELTPSLTAPVTFLLVGAGACILDPTVKRASFYELTENYRTPLNSSHLLKVKERFPLWEIS